MPASENAITKLKFLLYKLHFEWQAINLCWVLFVRTVGRKWVGLPYTHGMGFHVGMDSRR